MRRFLSTHQTVVAIGALALVSGLCAAALIIHAAGTQGLNAAALTGDARGYILLADNLRMHGVFSVATSAPYYPESFRAPGYPLFLAILVSIAGSYTGALVLQAALMALAPLLLYALVRPYHERAALWGSIVFAVEPLRLFYSASLLSDALFAVLLLGALLLLVRGRASLLYAAAAGAVLGAAMLVRPIAIFLPILFAGYLVWRAQSFKRGAALGIMLCAAAGVVVLPWSLRNHALFGSYNISSVGAANLVLYNAPAYLAYNPSPSAVAAYERFKAAQDVLPREEGLSLARAPIFTAAFRDIIAGHELSYALFHVYKTIPFFVTDGLRDIVRLFGVDIGAMPNISTELSKGRVGAVFSYMVGGGSAAWLFVAGAAFWGAVVLLWLWLCVQALRGRTERVWLFFAAVILYFALLTGPVSNARYRLPVEGLLLAAAAAGALELGFRAKEKKVH